MGALIAFRAVQGLGAGAVQPMSMTIVGDLYSLEERAKVQGYIASVWAVSSVVGPTLGGVFSEYLSWRWIFLVNIPLCLVAAATIGLRFTERIDRRRPQIDYAGGAVLTGALTLLLLGLLQGRQALPRARLRASPSWREAGSCSGCSCASSGGLPTPWSRCG